GRRCGCIDHARRREARAYRPRWLLSRVDDARPTAGPESATLDLRQREGAPRTRHARAGEMSNHRAFLASAVAIDAHREYVAREKACHVHGVAKGSMRAVVRQRAARARLAVLREDADRKRLRRFPVDQRRRRARCATRTTRL